LETFADGKREFNFSLSFIILIIKGGSITKRLCDRKMKIISDYPELKGKLFDSVQECAAEEAKVDKQRTMAKSEGNQASKDERVRAKEAVSAANRNLVEARKALKKAEIEAEKIMKDAYIEASAKAREILNPANEEYHKARLEYKKALDQYSTTYGPYRTSVRISSSEVPGFIKELFDEVFD
jgi:hypothetical protein